MTDTEQPKSVQAALYAALSKAQGEYQLAAKNREAVETDFETGEVRTWMYADLEEILSAVRPALAKYGLAFFQRLGTVPGSNSLSLISEISHEQGGVISSFVPVSNPLGLSDIRNFGAQLSLLKRYAGEALLGITSYYDPEGKMPQPEAAPVSPQGKQKAGSKKQASKSAPADTQTIHDDDYFFSQEEFDRNFPEWEEAIKTGQIDKDSVITSIESKALISDGQRQKIMSVGE